VIKGQCQEKTGENVLRRSGKADKEEDAWMSDGNEFQMSNNVVTSLLV